MSPPKKRRYMAKDVIGPDAKKLAAEVEPGKAVLLENVRFHAEEEKNDPEKTAVTPEETDEENQAGRQTGREAESAD